MQPADTIAGYEATNLRGKIIAATLSMRAARVSMLLRKAGFRPNQPRVPSGNRDGGQWADGGGGGASQDEQPTVWLVGDELDHLPEIPRERPPTIRERNGWAVRLAKYLYVVTLPVRMMMIARWLEEHAGDRIRAYLEPPRTLRELQKGASNPRRGFEIHHIVEQTSARQDGFPRSKINDPDNLVLVPTYRHWEITAWFATKNREYGNLSPREFLRGQGWSTRYALGLYALRMHGVLKP